MSIKKKLYFLIFLSILNDQVSGTIPDYIHACNSSDPELSACIIRTIDDLRPKLIDGIPELEVPPMEPLSLDTITLRKGINCEVNELKVWGPSAFEIIELKTDVPNNHFTFKVRLPVIHFQGKYDINTKILMVQLRGKGPIFGNLTDYAFGAELKGNLIEKNGEEYVKFDKMQLKITSGKTEIKMENLFRKNEILSRAANEVLSDNNEAIMNEVIPALEESLAKKFTEIANQITLRFTYKELFL